MLRWTEPGHAGVALLFLPFIHVVLKLPVGGGYSSVVERKLTVHEAVGLIPSTSGK